MNYGLYVSASGMLASMARQDVASNNLANVSTVGFKPDELLLRRRDAARVEDQITGVPSQQLLERLGAGVMPLPTRTSFGQGALRITSNPHDIAIEGDGFFMVAGPEGDQTLRLTRDGQLAISAEGRLVSAVDGRELLSEGGGTIRIDPSSPFVVERDGRIIQRGSVAGRLGVVTVPDETDLQKESAGRFAWRAGVTPRYEDATGQVVQGSLEESAVNPIEAMLAVTAASSAAQSNARMLQIFDELMGRAIAGLGRVT